MDNTTMEGTFTVWEPLIELYFELGLKYKDIKSVLSSIHNFHISERHLKRILSLRGYSRRKAYSGGLSLRRRHNYFSKGPNFIWHLESYDKLKPYGIRVNGCIDGFSRKIILLNAYTTNSDPKLIGGYYMESVQRLGGCPRVVRGDLGTENGYDRGFQRFLLPTQPCVQFWLAFLGDLRENGFFDGGLLDKSLLQFCCLGHIQLCKSKCVFRLSVPCDLDVYELCNVIMAESHLSLPNDPYQAVNLYMSLREAIGAVL
ncbi:hypothetical protein Q5P01_021967 [Channa striata]|uniref:Integrase core domain-containing protein n=1 Tax=Channa striata TaxID=64152 RepID=A0AA88J870_CHASR|nr:hypothetical protein Q5P01_021967 [Channa striata]